MPTPQLAHLELLAEVDSLLADLRAWTDRAPDWPPARACRAIVRRLTDRADSLRVRWEAPLVVATLGGTGTGKSTLVNALVGAEVTRTGRERPTTRKPTLICRPDLSPQDLGIDPASVQVVRQNLPALRDLVLIDCPDPDTTEDPQEAGTNLARLRELLPHCDVLLVTSTQQKYRSARVSDELAVAAAGAHLVFVQTHASVDEDIREDWRAQLSSEYEPGQLFYVDSLAALADAKAGLAPRGDFARLVDLLTRELAGVAAQRIRRANFLDLLEQTLGICRGKLDEGLPAIEKLDVAIEEQRAQLSARLASQLRGELLANRRHWENRLLGEVASHWGFSPFSLVLRAYQGLGALLAGATLLRMRTPAQVAIWGALEGGRRLRERRKRKTAERSTAQAASRSWEESELRSAALIVDGFAAEAGLPREELQPEAVAAEATESGAEFVESAADQLQTVISRLAKRHTGWFTRWRYELALLVMVGLLLYRLAKNFFYDTWLGPEFFGKTAATTEPYGMGFFIQAVFWLLLWCLLLLWLFTGRLRRGLRSEINELATRWGSATLVGGLFAGLQRRGRAARSFCEECQRLHTNVASLRKRFEGPEPGLGHRA